MSEEISKRPAMLCACRLGLAVGIVVGLGLLVLGLIATVSDEWCRDAVKLLGNAYLGFQATVGGAFIGLLWGFADGFVGTVIVVCLYNLFCRCGCCCCVPAEKETCCDIETPTEPEAPAESSQP